MAQAWCQADVLQAVDTSRLRVGGEIGRRIDNTVVNNLMLLDLDSNFLKPFRERSANNGYVGLGKTIDAFVRLAAYSQDERLLERKQYLVRETVAVQERDGYIAMCAPPSRMWTLWDLHEMAYIVHGLTTDFEFFANRTALDAARRLADYIVGRWTAEPDKVPGGGEIVEYLAFTGLESALLALFEACGDQKYLDFAARFRNLAQWDGPIILGRWGAIQGHAYAYLCRSLAQLRLYRFEPSPALLKTSRKAMGFLLRGDGLSVTGTCGQHECWHDSQEGAANLGETCATAYLLRWWDQLLRLEGNALYGDLMERAIHNALFAAQSPDGRHIRYYSPPEGPRAYFDRDTFCCPCKYRRIVGELPSMIYYRGKDGVYVNHYTASSAEINLPGGNAARINQETDYPHAGRRHR
jgi:DUF1680 family protein